MYTFYSYNGDETTIIHKLVLRNKLKQKLTKNSTTGVMMARHMEHLAPP